MSFSSFSKGLDLNKSELTTILESYESKITNCKDETSELKELGSDYAYITSEKIALNEEVCEIIENKKIRLETLKTKIDTIQNLKDDDKEIIYQAWLSSGLRKIHFLNIVIDRYESIISRVKKLNEDKKINDSNRKKLTNIIIHDERYIQKQNSKEKINYLVVEF